MNTTVTCHSTTAKAYFLKKEDFERMFKHESFDADLLYRFQEKITSSRRRVNKIKKDLKLAPI
jgi:hypothetical protein